MSTEEQHRFEAIIIAVVHFFGSRNWDWRSRRLCSRAGPRSAHEYAIDTAWGTANYTEANNSGPITIGRRNLQAPGCATTERKYLLQYRNDRRNPSFPAPNNRAVGGIDCNHNGTFNDRIVKGPDGDRVDHLLLVRRERLWEQFGRDFDRRRRGERHFSDEVRGQHRVGRAPEPAYPTAAAASAGRHRLEHRGHGSESGTVIDQS